MPETTVTVEIFGPNLFGVPETFHVHAPGCADGRKRLYAEARAQGTWKIE